MKTLAPKDKNQHKAASAKRKRSALELRIDEKGFIYSKHRNSEKLPVDDEEFAQFCQMLGCIALMEMRDNRRVLH